MLGENIPINDIIIPTEQPPFLKRKMALDPSCLDIWIFMTDVCIYSYMNIYIQYMNIFMIDICISMNIHDTYICISMNIHDRYLYI